MTPSRTATRLLLRPTYRYRPSAQAARALSTRARAAAAPASAETPTATPTARRAHSTSSASASAPGRGAGSASVSAEEVAHFDGLAATWWDPYGSSRLLHLMNPLRHDFLRQCVRDGAHVSHPAAAASAASAASVPVEELLPRRFLDVGCGGGIFAESAARLPTTTSVTAIDPSPEVLAVARAHARQDPVVHARLAYRQASIEDLSAEAAADASFRQYDVVTLFEVVEHVATDPGAFLDRCGRLLKPGGWLVMSTMARTWTSWLTTIVAAEDVLGIVPRGTHDWHKYLNADELAGFFAPGAAASASSVWQSQNARVQGVAYVPGLGWKVVPGGERVGNYFYGIQKTANK